MATRQSPRSSEGALRRLAASIVKGDPVCCITVRFALRAVSTAFKNHPFFSKNRFLLCLFQGAGLSADSGIPTFRYAPNSVWDEHTLRYARRDVFLKSPLKWLAISLHREGVSMLPLFPHHSPSLWTFSLTYSFFQV